MQFLVNFLNGLGIMLFLFVPFMGIEFAFHLVFSILDEEMHKTGDYDGLIAIISFVFWVIWVIWLMWSNILVIR